MKMLKHKETGVLYGYSVPKSEMSCMETVEVDTDGVVNAVPEDDKTDENTPTVAPTGTDARMAEIIKAIRGLDRNVAESFTQTGKPKVPAIEAALGYDITATERDAAYSAITE